MSSIVRSSHRLRGKMFKSCFKNTFDRPLVCSDSETSNNEAKDGDAGMNDAGNAETREDDPQLINNTQDRLRDPDDDFVDTPPGKRRKSTAKRTSSRGVHQLVTRTYQPFTGARIRPIVGIDNLITLAAGLNEEQHQTVNEIGFGSIFGYKVTCVPTSLANWLVSNYDPDTGVLNVGGGRIVNITSELVKSVFGLPMGPTDLAEKKKASKRKDVVVQEFKNQFKHMDTNRLLPVQLMKYILDW
ncbi:hypothetical protein Hdeb2414_s0022g00613641 [Helianthus debilis subsp. tardiflorus]